VRKSTVEARRTEILETTCQVVIERGFAATRVADVANKLGVSTGLIHYHFESKDQLLAEAFRYAAEADLVRLSEQVAKVAGPIAKLDQIFRLYTPEEAEPDWMLWIDGWGEALRSPALREISQALDLRWKRMLEQIIEDGVQTGEFTCSDPNAAAWRMAALLDGLSVQATVHEGIISRTQLLDWVRTAASTELGLAKGAFTAAGRGQRTHVA
jgi:AcrR family transcriptional regulator